MIFTSKSITIIVSCLGRTDSQSVRPFFWQARTCPSQNWLPTGRRAAIAYSLSDHSTRKTVAKLLIMVFPFMLRPIPNESLGLPKSMARIAASEFARPDYWHLMWMEQKDTLQLRSLNAVVVRFPKR